METVPEPAPEAAAPEAAALQVSRQSTAALAVEDQTPTQPPYQAPIVYTVAAAVVEEVGTRLAALDWPAAMAAHRAFARMGFSLEAVEPPALTSPGRTERMAPTQLSSAESGLVAEAARATAPLAVTEATVGMGVFLEVPAVAVEPPRLTGLLQPLAAAVAMGLAVKWSSRPMPDVTKAYV